MADSSSARKIKEKVQAAANASVNSATVISKWNATVDKVVADLEDGARSSEEYLALDRRAMGFLQAQRGADAPLRVEVESLQTTYDELVSGTSVSGGAFDVENAIKSYREVVKYPAEQCVASDNYFAKLDYLIKETERTNPTTYVAISFVKSLKI